MAECRKVRGQMDLLNGPIFKAMLLFAIPIFVSNVFQQLYNTMDTIIVGHTLGEKSLAAMGACAPIYDLLIGFSLGIGNGLSMVTARSYGSGDRDRLKKSVASSILIGLVLSIVMIVLTRFALRPLLSALQTPEEVLEEANRYISTITLFIGVTFAYNLCSGLLRAIGNSVMPLAFLMVSSVLNIGLDLLFIRQFGMGVQGAAVATVIAQGISVLLCLIYISQKTPLLIPEKKHFQPDKALYGDLLGQGLSMGLINSLVYTGSIVLQSGINSLGYLTIAGHAAARKLFSFCMMPISAMSHTVNIFVSQNVGADQGYRIRKGVGYACIYDAVLAAVLTVIVHFAAPAMIRLVSGSEEAVILQNGARYLQVAAPFFVVLGVLFNLRFTLQGLGMKLLPLVSSIIELVSKIIFALIFIPRFQYTAVIFCEPVIWCMMTAVLLYAYFTNPYIKAHGHKA